LQALTALTLIAERSDDIQAIAQQLADARPIPRD
jgi:hypothetical protein